MLRYINFFFGQNELLFEDVITLTLPNGAAEGPDGTKVNTIGMSQLNVIDIYWRTFVTSTTSITIMKFISFWFWAYPYSSFSRYDLLS